MEVMSMDTMQLAVVTPDRTVNEVAETSETQRRRGWFHRAPQPERKHRAQDLISRLRRELKTSQELSESLDTMLKMQLAETKAAENRVVELQALLNEANEKLRVATEANTANSNVVDFRFQQRQIAGPEDQATMPVAQVELLDDGELKAVAADAATALLERIAPRQTVEPETKLVPAYAPAVTRVLPLVVDPDEETAEEVEMYNETVRQWNARRTPPGTPVTWGQRSSSTLRADMSTTGTFRVTPLHSRGAGPSSLPGIAL